MANNNKLKTKVVKLKPGKYELRVETQPDADGIKHQRARKVKAASRSAAERKLREFIAEVLQEEPRGSAGPRSRPGSAGPPASGRDPGPPPSRR